MSEWRLIGADVLVLLGAGALTLAVVGFVRLPETLVRLHAASKAVVLGGLVTLAATLPASGADLVVRALMVALFLLLTAPVAATALARLAARRRDGDDGGDDGGGDGGDGGGGGDGGDGGGDGGPGEEGAR